MTEVRRGRKGVCDRSTLRYSAVSHNFDYVISIDAMGGKRPLATLNINGRIPPIRLQRATYASLSTPE